MPSIPLLHMQISIYENITIRFSIKVEEESIDLIVECNHQVDTIGEFDRKYTVLGSSASGNGT